MLFVLENTDQELEAFYRKIKLLLILGTALFRKRISQAILAKMIPLKEIPDQKKFVPNQAYQIFVKSLQNTIKLPTSLYLQ